MSEHGEDGGDADRTEQLHRAGGGDASPPLVIRGERYLQGNDEDSGERALLVPFVGYRGRTQFKLVPLPDLVANPYSAITDWLNFTFPLSPCKASIQEIVSGVAELLGPKAMPATERKSGKHRYEYAIDLGTSGALVCYGGNADTCLVSLGGESCSLAEDWNAVIAFGRDRMQGRVTRWDGAVDDYLGTHTVDLALKLWLQKKFGAGGNQPKLKQVGNWIAPDGSGRTVYIGRRENGKCLRVYEKGMQLGAQWHPWVRWELSYGNRDRILPWEVLIQPGQYVVGAYPKALSWIHDEASRVRTIQKQLQIGYEALTHHASRIFGPLINVMLEVEGDADKVVQKLRRDGRPKRLKHPFIDDPDEWLE